MSELKGVMEEVNKVFQMISSLPVCGDAVDVIAACRAKLKLVHAELEKIDDN